MEQQTYQQRLDELTDKLHPILERLRGEKLTREEALEIAKRTMYCAGNLIKKRVNAAMKERFSKPPNLIPPEK